MSHRIDDLFKRKVKHSSLDGHDNDWADAKALLNLSKDKRKGLFWLWGLGALALVVMMFWLLSNNAPQNELEDHKYEQEESDHEVPSGQNKTLDLISSESIAQTPISRSSTKSNSQEVNNQVVAEKRASENDRANIITLKSTTGTTNESNSITQKFSYSELNEFQTSESIVTQSSVGEGVNKNREISQEQKGQSISSRAFEEIKNQELNAHDANEKIALHSTIESIQSLPTSLLSLSPTIPNVPERIIPVTKEAGNMDIHPGLYIAYSPTRRAIGAGAFAMAKMNKSFSLDIGFGLKRQSMTELITYSDQQFDIRAAAISQISSANDYTEINLEIPLRVMFAKGRHNLFLGGVVERHLSLNGTQELSIQEEEEGLLDLAVDPGFAPSAIQPQSVIQNYNLDAIPDRRKNFFYAQIGYGFNVSQNFQLSSHITYRLNNQSMVSPLINNDNGLLENGNIWNLTLRINYIFGK